QRAAGAGLEGAAPAVAVGEQEVLAVGPGDREARVERRLVDADVQLARRADRVRDLVAERDGVAGRGVDRAGTGEAQRHEVAETDGLLTGDVLGGVDAGRGQPAVAEPVRTAVERGDP